MRAIRVVYLEGDVQFDLDRKYEISALIFNLDAIDLETRDGREEFVQRVGQWVDGTVLLSPVRMRRW